MIDVHIDINTDLSPIAVTLSASTFIHDRELTKSILNVRDDME